jgi:hypothetical protein
MENKDVPITYSIIYEGLYKNTFTQIFLQPILLFFVATAALIVGKSVNFDTFYIAIAMIAFWIAQGKIFLRFDPFSLFATAKSNSNDVKIVSRYSSNKISGKLATFEIVGSQVIITVEDKNGTQKEIKVPLSELSENTFGEIKIHLKDIKTTDFLRLEESFAKHGLKTKVIKSDYLKSLIAGTIANLFLVRLIVVIPVMIFYVYVILKLSAT